MSKPKPTPTAHTTAVGPLEVAALGQIFDKLAKRQQGPAQAKGRRPKPKQ